MVFVLKAVIITNLVLHKDRMPYTIRSLNFLEGTCLLSSIFILNAGILFYQSEFDQLQQNIL